MTPFLLLACLLGAADHPVERRDSVVVTGVYQPVALEEADRALTVFDADRSSTASTSVADLLRFDSSLDVRQRAPGGVQADLSIRGASFGQSLVLIDGLRVNDPQTGHHNLDLPLPLTAFSSVEVLKGSGSTLYGSDAVGGAVNLVTRPPGASLLRLGAAMGNFGTNRQQVTLSALRGRWAQRLDAARAFSRGFIPNRDYRDLSLSSATYLTTSLGESALTLGHADRPFGADMFYGNYPSWERTRTWFASLRQEVGSGTQAAFAFRRHTDLFVLQRDRPELYTNRHAAESFQGALRGRREIGANTSLHYGAEASGDVISSTNLGRHRRSGGAVYTALDIRALRRFSLSAGLREQLHGRGRFQLSPSVSAGAWLHPNLKLKASASHAFRLPSFTDLYYHDPTTIGSAGLRPERAWSFDGGVNWYARGRIRGEAAVFQRRETDGIDYVRSSPLDVWSAANIQRLRFTGVEALVSVRLWSSQQLEIRHTSMRGGRAALGNLQSRYTFNYPLRNSVVSWQGELPGRIAARARTGLTRRLDRKPYAVLDLHVTRAAGRLRPYVQFTNLGNVSYQEVHGVPMPGRAILAGLEWIVAGRFD